MDVLADGATEAVAGWRGSNADRGAAIRDGLGGIKAGFTGEEHQKDVQHMMAIQNATSNHWSQALKRGDHAMANSIMLKGQADVNALTNSNAQTRALEFKFAGQTTVPVGMVLSRVAAGIMSMASSGSATAAASTTAPTTTAVVRSGKDVGLPVLNQAFKPNANIVAGEAAAARAGTLHGALGTIEQGRRTTAVLTTNQGNFVAAGARHPLNPRQRALLGPTEASATRPVGAHAEIKALHAAQQAGATPQALGTTRAICPTCQSAIEASGGRLISPEIAIWSW